MQTSTTPSTETISTEPVYTIDASDRCDRCGAQAYVAAFFVNGPLLFCAHHAREHRAAIEEFIVQDDTDKLAPTNRQQGASY